jgi:hypothetical protein
MLKRIFIIVAGILILSVIVIAAYLKVSCSAIQIVKTHSGMTSYSIVNKMGNLHEPSTCNGSLIIYGME